MAYTTIKKPSDYFNTKLYTGTGSSNVITGVGFQPDFTWIKNRNLSGGYGHSLFDNVRGVNKRIQSHTTNAENTLSDSFNSFDSDGFTLGGDSQTEEINRSSASQVSWNWLANGTGVANTDGTISSTVSANTTAGFSVVKFTATGANGTIGHGLSVAPKMIILKNLSITKDWLVYHSSLGAGKSIFLNTTAVADTDNGYWNNTAPTSTTFSHGTWSGNNNGNEIIAYCFAEKQGYSKFGSYTGNASTDGTFVYTGFKPAFLMVFAYEAGNENWIMVDNKRDGFNVENEQLFPNTSGVEESNDEVDLLSNGFKLRRANTRMNGSIPYIYMCFAEEPLVGDNPATAR